MDLFTQKLILMKTVAKKKNKMEDSNVTLKDKCQYSNKSTNNIDQNKIQNNAKMLNKAISEKKLNTFKLNKNLDLKNINNLEKHKTKICPIAISSYNEVPKLYRETKTIGSQLTRYQSTTDKTKDATQSFLNVTSRSNSIKEMYLSKSQSKFKFPQGYEISKRSEERVLSPSESSTNIIQNSFFKQKTSDGKFNLSNEFQVMSDTLKMRNHSDAINKTTNNFIGHNLNVSNLSQINLKTTKLPEVDNKLASRSTSKSVVHPKFKLKKTNVLKTIKNNVYSFTSKLLKREGVEDSYAKLKKNSRKDNNDLFNNQYLDKESRKMLRKLDEQLQLHKGAVAVPSLKTGTAINKYIIRDFLIGETTDAVNSSKKKMKLTTEYLKSRDEKERKRIELLSERFELLENDSNPIIEEDVEIKDPDLITIPEHMNVNFNESDLYNLIQNDKKLYDKKLKEEIDENSKKLADMILDIDCSDYESVDSDDNNILRKNLYKKNIERTIRLRKILKSRHDPENDNLGFGDINKFKEQRRANDDELIKTLNKLGPPTFLKTKFKKGTIEKYKVVNGKYFGVMV